MTAPPQVVALGSVTAWVSGGTPDRAVAGYWDGSIPWISAASLKSIRIRDSDQHVTEAGLRAGTRLAPEGATLVLVRGMALHREVRAGLVTRPVSFNQDVKALIPGPSILPEFLTYSLHAQAPRILDLVSSAGSGTGVLDTGQLKRLQLVLPELPEQRAIIRALDDAESEIARLERLIAKKEAVKTGMMQQLLTGATRVPGFTDPWLDTRLKAISRVKTGSRNNQDKQALGRYPFFVRSATVERIDSFSYDCEAILVPGEGGIGSIFHYVNGKFEVHQRVYKISDFDGAATGRFVYHYMRQFFGAHAMENSVKATVDSLRLPTFNGFELHIPSQLEEQRAIATVLDDAALEIDVLRQRLVKARAVKQGTMQQLFTGRTRLPVVGGLA